MPRLSRPLSCVLASMLLAGCQPALPLAAPPSSPAPGARAIARLAPERTVPILRFGRVVDPEYPARQFYRGGKPSDAALEQLAALGIKTVVTLQDAADQGEEAADVAHEAKVVERLGMGSISLPIVDGGVPSPAIIDRVIDLARASEQAPVFVHCMWGRDRTGAVVAGYRIRENEYTADQALSEMAAFGYERLWYPELADFVRRYAESRP